MSDTSLMKSSALADASSEPHTTSFWRDDLYRLTILTRNEVRLRSRRWSTLAAVFLIMLVCWSSIVDPASGMSMMVIDGRRTLYNSSALALGSASMLGMLLMFAGFYLIRGRVIDDVRCGMAHVIAASPVSNRLFLSSRYLAGVTYFMLLAYTGMVSIMVLQAVRGEPGIHVMVYLQTYTLVFLPLACYVVSVSLLFDSVPRLMGKLGDLIFFILWCMQLSLLVQVIKPDSSGSYLLVFDFNGLMTLILNLQNYLKTTHISIGASSFDASLSPLILPDLIWSSKIVYLRLVSAIVALLPGVVAIRYFHRYSPDRLNLGQAQHRRSLMGGLNHFFQPARHLLLPLSRVIPKLPQTCAVIAAEMLVSLRSAPFLLLLLTGLSCVSCILPQAALATLLKFIAFAWALLIADMSCRDFQSGMMGLTVVHHGAIARFARHAFASCLIGLIFALPLLCRLLWQDSSMAYYAVSGFIGTGVLATTLGYLSGTSRLFIALFLLWFYIATQAQTLSKIDLFGFNRAADLSTLLVLLTIGVTAFVVGYGYNRFRHR